MVTAPDTEAQILRYYHAEKWRVGTIARQLHVHHDVVRRVLARSGLPCADGPPRRSKIDPYLPFIQQTLQSFPTLTAARIFRMVREHGYPSRPDHFRHLIARHRPRRKAEAYPRLRTLPGEEAQIDWGHFGHLTIGRARRPLMAFVAVLSHSRQIFPRYFLDARMENFLRGHVGAFTAWGGTPRVLLYDNLKSAVLERRGDAIRFHPTLLNLAGHYRYEPRPVPVARGNEKGRVERAIRYIRDAFFAARTFRDLDDLNAQAKARCHGIAADRQCPDDPQHRRVRDVFAEEVSRLLPLPDNPVPLLERVEVSVGKTPYVRFDLNDYSVPHQYARRILTVLADPHEVRIVDGIDVLACHQRSYDKGKQIEIADHIKALIDEKRAARQHRTTDQLAQAAPASQILLVRAAERGANLGAITNRLLRLLERNSNEELQAAILDALARDAPHPNAVRLALERRRKQRGEDPPIAVVIPPRAFHRLRRRNLGPLRPRMSKPATSWCGHTNSKPMTSLPEMRQMTETNAMRARAGALNLQGVLAHWGEVGDQAWLAELLNWEEQERARRSLERRLASAHIGKFKPVCDFDWKWPKKCDREVIEALLGLDFLQENANIVVAGPNGVGKTTIARNIAHRALIAGHTVLFTTAGQLLGDLAEIDSNSTLRRRLRHYARPQLPVIDEIGYLSYSNRHADIMFELISRRYQNKSTLVTTNRSFKQWSEV